MKTLPVVLGAALAVSLLFNVVAFVRLSGSAIVTSGFAGPRIFFSGSAASSWRQEPLPCFSKGGGAPHCSWRWSAFLARD